MSGFFGRSFYNEVDQIIKSHDDRLEYDAKFCEKKKEIKFILELYQLEDDEIKEIQEKCLKIFLDEKKKNPAIFKLSIENSLVSFTCHNTEYFAAQAEFKKRMDYFDKLRELKKLLEYFNIVSDDDDVKKD